MARMPARGNRARSDEDPVVRLASNLAECRLALETALHRGRAYLSHPSYAPPPAWVVRQMVDDLEQAPRPVFGGVVGPRYHPS